MQLTEKTSHLQFVPHIEKAVKQSFVQAAMASQHFGIFIPNYNHVLQFLYAFHQPPIVVVSFSAPAQAPSNTSEESPSSYEDQEP